MHRTSALGERECLHMAEPVGWQLSANERTDRICPTNQREDQTSSGKTPLAQLTNTQIFGAITAGTDSALSWKYFSSEFL